VLGTRLHSVEVFHPNQKRASVGTRRQPRNDSGTKVAEVQLTRRRWRKPPGHVPIMPYAATSWAALIG
jgi:hypothetical protein